MKRLRNFFSIQNFRRVQQLEEENSEMKVNVCRLKSQTEKLDQVNDVITVLVITVNINDQLLVNSRNRHDQ